MRRFFGVCLILICSILLQTNTANAQEEKKNQLWFCMEEVVLTDHWKEYKDLSKEIITICKESDFPFSFYAWATGELSYAIWFPIDSYADLDKMKDAWKVVIDKMGEDKVAAFRKTLKCRKTYTAVGINSLAFVPENIRFNWDDVKYCRWSEFYLKPGTVDDVKKIITDANAFLKEKEMDDPWYVAMGGIGYEGPVVVGFSYGVDAEDFWAQTKRFKEKAGDDFKQFSEAFYKNVRKVVRKEFWYSKELSYEREKKSEE
ncbi:hypothetical protein EYV94_04200 [Puteibacter caeruleilacunae]|nr:hypothetical protein EYV94_04200 [Puteibacter caeruleilacunae]